MITIERAGNLQAVIKEGVEKGILEICAKVSAQAKSLTPVDSGLLRIS